MRIFLTGASGYIGGSVGRALAAQGHEVRGLLRGGERAGALGDLGIEPVIGSLDDAELLHREARGAEAVIHAADADHRPAAEALLAGLAGTGRLLLHTSGSSIVGTQAGGRLVPDIFDERTPFTPSPGRAARTALTREIVAAHTHGVRTVVIAPALIYGRGRGLNPESMQIPWLLDVARKTGSARHVGPGLNRWSNVHIDDLVELYLLLLDRAPAGSFYFAENGENSMQEACAAISRMLGLGGGTVAMTVEEAAQHWGDGPARNTMGSNSRVRSVRARSELGWRATGPALIAEIEEGCYAS